MEDQGSIALIKDVFGVTLLRVSDSRAYAKALAAERQERARAEKKAAKGEKDKLEAPYTTCVLDGRKEKVGNFRIEPPGLFRGRGEHPKKGSLKVCLSRLAAVCVFLHHRSCAFDRKM